MNKLIIIFIIIGFFSCLDKQKSEKETQNMNIEKPVSELTDFKLIQNFEENKGKFKTDTIELNDHSTDGGELKIFRNNKSDYIVLDFWLYGETGRLNYTYWTDKNFDFKIVKKLNYEYDKPYYMDGFKTDSTIYYLSYSDSKNKLFNINKSEITNEKLIDSTKMELESFFNDVTKGIDIIKQNMSIKN